ncbi:alanine racemase [Pseudomonadales bacterium]|nr:alanine racemase [Pseudomonadales bacterium]
MNQVSNKNINNHLSIKTEIAAKLTSVRAYINLAALRHNASIAQSMAPNAKLIAVIKANAYGHGIIDTATALSSVSHGFAVARIDEAIMLRDNGFKQMIIVMSPALSPDTLQLCAEHQLTAVIHSDQNINLNSLPSDLDYWLKVDSGMHRLGLSIESLSAALENIDNCSPPTTLMSHFSNAESKDESTNQSQMQCFKSALTQRKGKADYQLSLSNSAALLRHNNAANYQQWQSAQLDNYPVADEYIRPGIMLYGADPLEEANNASQSLFPVMTLAAPILAIRTIKTGETVGYNGNWQAKRESVIATIGIGYGDGYPRHAPNGTPVIIHGQRAPLTGNVSMDTISVDITDIVSQGVHVEPGDSAELWGENLAANEVAQLSETIAYELFTDISQRVARILL